MADKKIPEAITAGLDLTDFLLGVAETAIGAFLAFLLGFLAFILQQRHAAKANAELTRLESIDALNRITQTSGLNIESLVQTKLQLAEKLQPEVLEMMGLVRAYHDASIEERSDIYNDMRDRSSQYTSFYQSFTPLQIMEMPEVKEFSALLGEMPALTAYTHRAMATMRCTDEYIRDRNEMIAIHAVENASNMPVARFIYHMSMLSGIGQYICQTIDDDLQFFCLAMDQVEFYMKANCAESQRLRFDFVDEVKRAIPAGDLFPALSAQMATFDK